MYYFRIFIFFVLKLLKSNLQVYFLFYYQIVTLALGNSILVLDNFFDKIKNYWRSNQLDNFANS